MSGAIKFLIVEDDTGFTEIAQRLLAPMLELFPGGTVTVVTTIEAALEVIGEVNGPDVTLLDLTLPPKSIQDTLSYLPRLEARTAVVILTGHKEEFVRKIIGAVEVLTPIVEKDKFIHNPSLLTRAICRAVDIFIERKWKTARENLQVMRSICHAEPTRE